MTHDTSDSGKPSDPERLLASGLRETTPEFEARFDQLRRRLAQEQREPHAVWYRTLWDALRARPWWAGAAVTGATLAVVIVLVVAPRPRSPAAADTAWYLDATDLDESLRGALLLLDEEARAAVSLMPLDGAGGES